MPESREATCLEARATTVRTVRMPESREATCLEARATTVRTVRMPGSRVAACREAPATTARTAPPTDGAVARSVLPVDLGEVSAQARRMAVHPVAGVVSAPALRTAAHPVAVGGALAPALQTVTRLEAVGVPGKAPVARKWRSGLCPGRCVYNHLIILKGKPNSFGRAILRLPRRLQFMSSHLVGLPSSPSLSSRSRCRSAAGSAPGPCCLQLQFGPPLRIAEHLFARQANFRH